MEDARGAPRNLRVSRGWRSFLAALAIGLLAPLLILNASNIETLAAGKRIAGNAQTTAAQALVDKLDTAVYDTLYQLRGPHFKGLDVNQKPIPSAPQIVIVTLDPNGIETVDALYSRWKSHYPPFPRRVYADLIRRLDRAGAAVIGIDVVFATPSSYNDKTQDDDRSLAAAMRAGGNVVLAAEFNATQQAGVDFVAQKQDFPIEMLRTAARAVCPVNVPRDNLDNDVRRFWLTQIGPDDPGLPLGQKPYPSFGPMIAALYLNSRAAANSSQAKLSPAQFDEMAVREMAAGRFAGKPVPFHRQDSQTLDQAPSVSGCYPGFPGGSSFAIRSIGEALDPQNSDAELRTWFENKVVLIGSWSAAEQDFYNTPLQRRAADRAERREDQETLLVNAQTESDHRFGVDVHAAIIHTLLSGHAYRDFDETRRIALVWFCGLVTAILVARLRPVIALAPIVALLVLMAWLAQFSFSRYVFVRPVQIGLTAVFAYGLESVYFYAVENRRAQLARNTFRRYVGPRVMERVLDTDFVPGTVEQRYLTIMFTDVQGFTSLSEKMSPHEVVATFNRYLNEMVAIIDRHEGTLDKIMGDGVMAYFNAPVAVPNHEERAVECALEMQAAMRAWRELSESLGLPPLKVRIGINAGEVVFGEVGAKRQLGYTVIGDAVNAAARLEPLNKEFGTEILISEIVRSRLDETFVTEYVGELAIRGREEGIRAYSVTGRRTADGGS